MVPYTDWRTSADPLAYALQSAGFTRVGWIVALGAAVSMSAVLLVFQYGQPRIFFCDGARRPAAAVGGANCIRRRASPHTTTLITGIGVALASLIGDAAETYDLTNIGTLFAFALVSIGVLVLRVKEPERPRPFKVPLVWVVAPLGAARVRVRHDGLPKQAWERFGIWLVVGIFFYFAYGFSNSRLRK